MSRLGPAAAGLLSLAWPIAALAADAVATTAPGLARPSALPPVVVSRWLTSNTSIAPDTVVSVGDAYIVAVLSSRPVDPAHPRILHLEIRAEMTDPALEAAKQLRSLSASLEVNCIDHTSHFIEVRTFAAPNLGGAEQVNRPTEGWLPDPKGSYFEDIDTAVCNPGAPRPLLAAKADAPPAKPAQPSERATLALRPGFAADAPPAKPGPPPPAARALRPSRPGAEAQIAAAPSEAQAQAALAALKSARADWMGGLSTRVERIDRKGVAYYRALVFGFAPPADAASFCRQMSAAGRACLVR